MFFLVVLLFLFGLCIGSFLNVVIWRAPRDESVVYPPSRCPACGRRIRYRDLVPVVSWLLLGGRCRDCGSVLPARYALVELAAGALFAGVYFLAGWGTELAAGLLLVSFLLVITGIDLEHQLILDKINLWFGAAGLGAVLATGRLSLPEAGLGALLAGGVLLAIVLLTDGMGMGDACYAAAAGLWLGWKLALVMLLLAFLSGGIIGSLLLIFRIRGRKDPIPFGPFLCLATFVAWFWGEAILRWYWSLGT
ncbi:MAG TPA: prepilin peptidase [Selenomonadales bacterium]|nr:prepilin peptidase [Selenomonadales bacterium]